MIRCKDTNGLWHFFDRRIQRTDDDERNGVLRSLCGKVLFESTPADEHTGDSNAVANACPECLAHPTPAIHFAAHIYLRDHADDAASEPTETDEQPHIVVDPPLFDTEDLERLSHEA